MAGSNTRLNEIAAFFKSRPERLEPGAVTLQVKETHISLVLITEEFVYKFKKPVRYAFIDQENPDARRRNCRREFELNRRLAPDVYLGLREVVQRGESFALEATALNDGIETCVLMRRLPDAGNLKNLLKHDAVSPHDISRIARVMGDFHLACPRGPHVTELRDFPGFLGENLAVLKDADGVQPSMLADIKAMHTNVAGALRSREGNNRIVDGHGDLRLDRRL